MRAHPAGHGTATVGQDQPPRRRTTGGPQRARPRVVGRRVVRDPLTGALAVRGLDIRDVWRSTGTPASVLDEDDVRSRMREWRDGVRRRRRLLRRQGVPVRGSPAGSPRRVSGSTSAPGESSPSRCAPGSRRSGSRSTATTSRAPRSSGALDAGVGRIVVDSFEEIAARGGPRRGPRAACGRAGPGDRRRRGAHPRVHRDRPRGPEVRLLPGERGRGGGGPPDARAEVAEPGRLHSHIGSQIFDTPGFEVAAHRVVELLAADPGRARRLELAELDLGGGLGIAYSPATTRHAGGHRRRPAPIVARECARVRRWPVPRLAVEPGRAIAGPPSTITLYEVGTVKPVEIDDRRSRDVRLRRRRHERQHPHRALRRRVHVRARLAVSSAPADAARASSASTASPGTWSSRTPGCRPTSPPATCSRSPPPAPTAGRWPRTTTTCPGRRWSRCVAGEEHPGAAPPGDESRTCSRLDLG